MTIDIMMPFYGDPALFKLAVTSVVEQTDTRWRLVVIDDQYPELEPGEWLTALGDSRIEYIRNPENLGVSGNFQRSVDLATHDYMVIMGCDDLMRPNYVSEMHDLISAFPDAAYFQPGVVVIDSVGATVFPLADRVKAWYRSRIAHSARTKIEGEALAATLLKGNWTYFPSICWRTSSIRAHGFDPQFDVVLDLALQLNLALDGGTLVASSTVSFEYRRHAASVSSWKANDGSRFTEEAAFFDQVASRLRERGWSHAAGIASAHLSSRLNALTRVPSALRSRDVRGVQVLLRHAFKFRTATGRGE